MPGTLYDKLAWRARFLLGGTPPIVRERLGGNPFSIRERLTFINPLSHWPHRDKLIRQSLRRGGGRDDYFPIGGLCIYFRPDFPMEDVEALLSGVVLILKEAYFFCDHFSDEVRIQPGDWILDLGGNLGTSAIAFSRLAGPGGASSASSR
jgi:hypothetical protein